MRGACGRWKWKVLVRRGHSEAKIAQAVAAPELMQPQPSPRVAHASIVASAHGRSTLRSENGRFWGGEAILRPFLHWQCQLGTIPYTVP